MIKTLSNYSTLWYALGAVGLWLLLQFVVLPRFGLG